MCEHVQDKMVVVLCWAVALARHIFLSVMVLTFINLIFVYNSTCQQYYCIYQNGHSILNMGFEYYRQFSLCLIGT